MIEQLKEVTVGFKVKRSDRALMDRAAKKKGFNKRSKYLYNIVMKAARRDAR